MGIQRLQVSGNLVKLVCDYRRLDLRIVEVMKTGEFKRVFRLDVSASVEGRSVVLQV